MPTPAVGLTYRERDRAVERSDVNAMSASSPVTGTQTSEYSPIVNRKSCVP
jgi:hypothetical protein